MTSRFRPLLLFAAGLLSWQPVALAAPPESGPAASAATIEAEMMAFGEWLLRLNEIVAPMQEKLAGLYPSWEAARAGRGGYGTVVQHMRSVVAQSLASADAVIVRLEALETPDFPALDLPDDVKPAAIRRETLSLAREIRDIVAGFNPVLDAIAANDPEAMERAGLRLLASVRLVFESQATLRRASLAATPRDDWAWEVTNLELLYFRTGALIFEAWRPLEPPRIVPRLADDMLALAAELEANARRGDAKIDADLAEWRTALTEAERSAESNQAGVLRRAIALGLASRDYLAISRDVATILRSQAPQFRGRSVTQGLLVGFFRPLREIRVRMEAVARRMAAVIAESN